MDFTNQTIESVLNHTNDRYEFIDKEFVEEINGSNRSRYLLTMYDKTTEYNLSGHIVIETATGKVLSTKQFKKE